MPGIFAPGPRNYTSRFTVPLFVLGVAIAYFGMAKMHPASPMVVIGGIVVVLLGSFIDLGKRDGSPKAKIGVMLFVVAGVLFALSNPTRTAHLVQDVGNLVSNFGDKHFK